MLTGNAATVLANLDWLQYHLDMKLDYSAEVVRNKNGEPEFTLADLATAGLTPATDVNLKRTEEHPMVSRAVREWEAEGSPLASTRRALTACYRAPIGAMVHGPGCPHTP